jgi:hypothetical protein
MPRNAAVHRPLANQRAPSSLCYVGDTTDAMHAIAELHEVVSAKSARAVSG